MVLPSREQCLALLEKYGIPEHIVRHSLAVERVAVFLAKKFNETGVPVNTGLVSRAALLHDIDKIETLKEGFGHLHGKMSREILEKEGFPEIGKIAERHHLERLLPKKPFFPQEKSLGKNAPVGAKPFFSAEKSLGKNAPVGAKPFDCWEEKIVFYADKRVNHDKIVSLDGRFDYLLKRYGVEKDIRGTILKCRPFAIALEKEILAKIKTGKGLGGLN